MQKSALRMISFLGVAVFGAVQPTLATPAKNDFRFCMYENPKKPEENLRYRATARVKYKPSDPGCIIEEKGVPNPGALARIVWPDGVETRIYFKTKISHRSAMLSGIATVDGELADWSALEEICLIIRNNGKKICY